MLNLFGRSKNNGISNNAVSVGAKNHDSKYSIQIDIKGRIIFISFGLKEYFLIHDIYDVTQILPKNLPQFCQALTRSKQSQVVKCESSEKVWMWEFSLINKNAVIVNLLNYEDFENNNRAETNENANQLNEEIFGSVPGSICITSHDDYQIIYSNEKFHQMFKASNGEYKAISSLINAEVLSDIESSLQDSNEVENVLFIHEQLGESFWQNKDRFISVDILKSKLIIGDALVWKFEDISDFKNLQNQHELYKKKFNTAIQAATEGIWEWSKLDEHGDWWSKPMYSLLGLDADNSKPSFELMKRLMHPKEKKVFDHLIENEMRTKQHFSMECRLTVKEHGFRWFRLRVVGAFDSSGSLKKLIGSLVNIHSEKTNRLQLQLEKDKAVATLNSIVDAVISTDAEGIIEYQNSAAERLTGISKDQAKGMHIDNAISFYKEHSLSDIKNPVTICLSNGERMNQKIYADMLDKDGTRYTVQVMATPLVRKEGQVYGAVLVLNDVTNIRVLSRRLKYQASHDILTKLINRSEFEKRVRNAITHAQNGEGNSAVLYIDLDRFKLINDICGHAAGDELLKQVAKLLRVLVDKKS